MTALLAFYIPGDLANALALSAEALPLGARPVPPGELHLTLALLPDGEVPIDVNTLNQVLVGLTIDRAPIAGVIGGVGRFNPSESSDGDSPLYASFDAPDLAAFRQALVDVLFSIGLSVSTEHGFTPHITLAYLPPFTPADQIPFEITIPTIPIQFDLLSLVVGETRTDYVFSGQPRPMMTHTDWQAEGTVTTVPEPDEIKTNALKAISRTDDELRVGNYIVLFGGRDLEGLGSDEINPDGSIGEFFTPATEFDSPYTATKFLHVDWEHGRDPDRNHPDPRRRGPGRDDVLGYVDWKTARKDNRGLWVERVLDRHNSYIEWLEMLIDEGIIGNSSEAIDGQVQKKANGEIVRWPLRRDTLTVKPMDWRMKTENVIQALKALHVIPTSNSESETPTPDESDPPTEPTQPGAAEAGRDSETTVTDSSSDADAEHSVAASRSSGQKAASTFGDSPMNKLLEKIKELVPGLTDEQLAQIASIIDLALADPAGVLGDEITAEQGEEMMAVEDDPTTELSTKALKNLVRAAARKIGVKAAWVGVSPNGATPSTNGKKKAVTRPAYAFQPAASATEEDDVPEAQKAAHTIRYGDEDAAMKAVMKDLLGNGYRQQIGDMGNAYAKYLRFGASALSLEEQKSLKRQIFPAHYIKDMIREGFTVAAIKDVMVEAQGSLGGWAVPPAEQQQILSRLPGLTAVRGGGAQVYTLTQANSTDLPVYDGGDDSYVGNIRGQWGNETAAPGEQNAKVKLVTVVADLYTYKIPMSATLVEDAANLVQKVNTDIGDTLAIDEDYVFIKGDGVGKPLGILPGNANLLALREVVSQNASALTTPGIKALKRGLPSQYRKDGVFVGNSDTYALIEALLVSGTGSDFAFPDLSETDLLLQRKVFESEAMADVAASAYPLLFANMKGYGIVERLGLTIERFHDSNTGINKVEFHVRRRIGGRVTQPWLFAVQKISA